MGIFIGNNNITPSGIDKAYIGNDLIYQSRLNIVAKLTPTEGAAYSTDISDWTTKDMKLISMAISNNSTITMNDYVVYVDYGRRYYKLSCELNTYTKKSMNIDGANYDFVILGFNHDDLANSTYYGETTTTGKAGITWQMENCSGNNTGMNSSNTNIGGWTQSNMRTSVMVTLLNGFNFKNAVAPVLKKTSAGNASATISTDTDNLFLLSEIEIFGSNVYSKAGEGTQYAWYKADNTKQKKVSGSPDYWWERSPRGSNATTFCMVGNAGDALSNSASNSRYVVVGFCS